MTDQPQGPTTPQPEWQPTNPPAPAAPKKSWFVRHKILTGIIVLFASFAVAKAVTGGDAAPTSATPATSAPSAPAATDAPPAQADPAEATAAEEPAAAGIGDKVRDGKFEFVVTKVEDGGTLIGTKDFGETAQGKFHLVHLTVTNISNDAQMMFADAQKVTDDQGRQFDPNTMAGIHIKGNDSWIKDVNPGNTLTGIIVYDMPEGSTPVSIELHDSLFSGGVTVSLR